MKVPSIILGLLASLSLGTAHIGGSQLMLQELNPQFYCGRNLARALAQICSFQSADKRSESGTMYNALLPPYYKEQEHLNLWPWLTPHKAHAITTSRGKRFMGVADECCDKPCSIDEMLSYCN